MKELVAIIVLNRDQAGFTRDCLHSLQRLEYPQFHIVVVDNGSTDDALRGVARDFPQVDFLWLDQNLGVAGGRNAGLRHALQWQPGYILFLDNDTLVAPDFLTRLVTRIQSDERIAAVQPKIYFADPPNRICTVGGKLYPRISHYRSRGSGEQDRGQYDEPAEIDWLSGCAALARARVFHQLGLLDETYSPYCHEDVDWSLRLRRAGYRLMVEPSAVLWHRVSSRPQTNPAKFMNQVRGYILLLRFHTRRFDIPLSVIWLSWHVARRYILPAFVRHDSQLLAGVFQGVRGGFAQELLPIEMPSCANLSTRTGEMQNTRYGRRRKKIFLLGVLGPLDSGPTRVYASLLKSQFARQFEIRFLDVRLTRDVTDFERLRPQKFLNLLRHLLRATYWLSRERYHAACIPLATNRNAFLKDSLFIWLAAFFGVPVVVFEHGTGIPGLHERSGRFVRWFMRTTLKQADRCIVLGDRLRFNFEPFLPAERIAAVHLGIDVATPNGQRSNGRGKGDVLTVLYLSTLLRVKGLGVLLQSLPHVLRVRKNLHCVVAGAWGRDSKELKAWVSQFLASERLENIVSFVGPVQDDYKSDLFGQADIFVFPTLVDSYGIVLLEALRAGLPIVATNVGAGPEIVRDGINGLICEKGSPEDLAEKILYLAEHPELRQQMHQNNLERFRHFFTVEHFASRMIAVFESLAVGDRANSQGTSLHIPKEGVREEFH